MSDKTDMPTKTESNDMPDVVFVKKIDRGQNLYICDHKEGIKYHSDSSLQAKIKEIDKAIYILELATIASCNCCTKTPLPEHHDEHCRYKAIKDAIAVLESIKSKRGGK